MVNYSELTSLLNNSEVKYDEPLKKYSYTKTGGNSDILILVKSTEDLVNIVNFANINNIPLTILGNGSNILISDKGIRGITVITSELNKIEILENNIVTCEAGATLKELTDILIEEELTGLEFACGIPGSIGGAIFMNAGAYGGEMKDVVLKVETIDKYGNIKIYNNEQMEFSYRHSIIQDNKEIVTKIYFKLQKGIKENIIAEVNDLNKKRSDKQPLEYPSCGSVFKRPEGHFAGKLIQDAGCQGLTVGGAQVSTKHAGFMVNIDNASCEDYKNLIKLVQEKVFENSGVKLEREVKIIGE
ncbi:UDP-N-acetylmuramate dehydrogenase [Gemelliphila palaticanis]|uniref:UDP-N-acetylenolpyruvoylglucosamine reductase n=1 Tax=Gemelliphila palaticanis TaxID=81950 RepID=A0ABX2SYJ0_9BACL|nr:UDP-N-acetylmuramate dehydrogenase [Gemella palaticanis]MBF0715147.1 UDP-N-acetylmuramate dehydrogenase [Gemella palaticanis]NYS47077.1 UDP-N-acetylmuramate dehydrogenase [Gemella palaticanis]